MAKVLTQVSEQGAKVILVGDPEQLQAILAGAPFRAISDRTSFAELTEIWRQQVSWQKAATIQFATGQTHDALMQYVIHDGIHEHDNQIEVKAALIDAWNDARIANSDKTQLMLAYTRADVLELNTMARSIRESLGELGNGHILQIERGERTFAEGDRIYFLQNDRALGVKNGTLGTIIEINQQTLTTSVNKEGMEQPDQITFTLDRYNHFDYGYATTIHKSQGTTVDQCFVLTSKYLDRHATYVSMTRHKENVELFWSKEEFKDFKEMTDILSRERSKEFTLDYPESDYAGYRSIESDRYPLFESPDIVQSTQVYYFDWNEVIDEIKQNHPEIANEIVQRMTESDDSIQEHTNTEPDWQTKLFAWLEQENQKNESKDDAIEKILKWSEEQNANTPKEDLSFLLNDLEDKKNDDFDFSRFLQGNEHQHDEEEKLLKMFGIDPKENTKEENVNDGFYGMDDHSSQFRNPFDHDLGDKDFDI